MAKLTDDEIRKKLSEREGSTGSIGEEVSLVSVSLPKTVPHHRRRGFWPNTIKQCRDLEFNQAIKVRILAEESPATFVNTARTVAKELGFYLNAAYKHPFMYLWPDKIRGKILPEDRNSKNAIFFDDVVEE